MTRMTLQVLLLGIAAAALLAGCGGQEGGGVVGDRSAAVQPEAVVKPFEMYLPLVRGNWWKYRSWIPEGTGTQLLKVAGTERIDGVIWMVCNRRYLPENVTVPERYRHLLVGTVWRQDATDPSQDLFRTPLEVGTNWLTGGDGIYYTRTILSLHASTVVPAGSFTDCLLIEGVNYYYPERKFRSWYAPGVGLVRQLHTVSGVRQREDKLMDTNVGPA